MALRPFRNSDSTVAVSMYDPAFDADSWNALPKDEIKERSIKLYRQPSLFRELMPTKQGLEWTVFEIGVVPIETLVRIADESQKGEGQLTEECQLRCFLHGVRSIKPWTEKIPTKEINGVEYIDPEWLKKTFVRGLKNVALNIGAQIWRWNHLMEDEIKN